MSAPRRGAERPLKEEAVSDVLGTVFLMAVTVAVIATFALSVLPAAEETEAAPVELVTSARPGEGALTLTHAGGGPVDQGATRVIVTVNGQVRSDSTLGPVGAPWRVGDLKVVALSAPLAAGDQVEVSLVSVTRGTTLDTATLRVPSASPPVASAGTFTLSLRFDSSTNRTSVAAPGALLVRASVFHASGRQAIQSVSVNLTELGGTSALLLRDDGSGGDATAGDQIHSTYAVVSPVAPIGTRLVTATAVDFDGAIASGTGLVTILSNDTTSAAVVACGHEDCPAFNTSRIERVGIRAIKGTDPEKITLHILIQPKSDPVWFDGQWWVLDDADFDYYWLKPGSGGPTELEPYCSPTSLVKGFKAENATVKQYDNDREPLLFFVNLEWKSLLGESMDSIDSTTTDEFLIFPRTDQTKVWQTYGWPTSFSCP